MIIIQDLLLPGQNGALKLPRLARVASHPKARKVVSHPKVIKVPSQKVPNAKEDGTKKKMKCRLGIIMQNLGQVNVKVPRVSL